MPRLDSSHVSNLAGVVVQFSSNDSHTPMSPEAGTGISLYFSDLTLTLSRSEPFYSMDLLVQMPI